jgi:hypothetical protein
MRTLLRNPERLFKKLINTKKQDLHLGFFTVSILIMLLCFLLGYASVVKENYQILKVHRNSK